MADDQDYNLQLQDAVQSSRQTLITEQLVAAGNESAAEKATGLAENEHKRLSNVLKASIVNEGTNLKISSLATTAKTMADGIVTLSTDFTADTTETSSSMQLAAADILTLDEALRTLTSDIGAIASIIDSEVETPIIKTAKQAEEETKRAFNSAEELKLLSMDASIAIAQSGASALSSSAITTQALFTTVDANATTALTEANTAVANADTALGTAQENLQTAETTYSAAKAENEGLKESIGEIDDTTNGDLTAELIYNQSCPNLKSSYDPTKSIFAGFESIKDISELRFITVPTIDATTFDYPQARELTAGQYVSCTVSPSDGDVYTATIEKDFNENPIATGSSYTVFVLIIEKDKCRENPADLSLPSIPVQVPASSHAIEEEEEEEKEAVVVKKAAKGKRGQARKKGGAAK